MECHHWKALTIAWNLSHLLLLAPERWLHGSSSESLGQAPSSSSCFSVSLWPMGSGSVMDPGLLVAQQVPLLCLSSGHCVWPST